MNIFTVVYQGEKKLFPLCISMKKKWIVMLPIQFILKIAVNSSNQFSSRDLFLEDVLIMDIIFPQNRNWKDLSIVSVRNAVALISFSLNVLII